MLRTFVCAALALVICVGGLLAGEGSVVSFEKGKLTVKVGDKEQVVELKGVKVFDDAGTQVKGKDVAALLKKDLKVELVEKNGKVVEIKVKK
jgi:hypothetical protein